MLLISHVAAEFRDRNGNTLYTIRGSQRNTFLAVPDTIRQDPLFDLLLQDGSIDIPETALKTAALENDPTEGITPDGKKAKVPVTETKSSKSKKSKSKSDPAETKRTPASAPESGEGTAPDPIL